MIASPEGRLAGARLGPYEIVSPLGTGGMGEVYRARDTRLNRDVAIKVLPEEFAADRNRLKRFEQEARAVSSLSHPNIVTVYEIGESEAGSYIAMELVEGQTLRQLLRSGGMPLRKALDVGVQIADGLARAHEAGVVHRDLKPDNVMVTPDGLVKVLDFGLAKLTRSPLERGAGPEDGTLPLPTQPGVLIGTVRYMSPEQAGGSTVDFRADQFAFGSVLYEMATGRPPFQGETTVDTLSAILHDDPDPIEKLNPRVPVPLRWIIERCLAKDAKDRYAATRDLARDLALLSQHWSQGSGSLEVLPLERPRRGRRLGRAAAALVAFLAVAAAAYLIGSRAHAPSPRYRQLTFRSAGISTARFARDGQTIVYSAQWDGRALELFMVRTESPESRPLGLTRAVVLSVSSADEMALLLGPSVEFALRPPHAFVVDRDPRLLYGSLARAPLGGGEPREVLEEVRDADWAPDGRDLAVVRFVDGKDQLEYPLGRIVERSVQWLNHPRVSPDGRRVAYQRTADVVLTDDEGHPSVQPYSASEIAWHPPSGDLLISQAEAGSTRIRALRPGGSIRDVATLPGDFVLQDVDHGGRLLLGRVFESAEVLISRREDPIVRRLSWFERSTAVDLSAAGDVLLFSEAAAGTGRNGSVYLRKTDGSPARLLGEGVAMSLSRDGAWVLAWANEALWRIPTGPGKATRLDTAGIKPRSRGAFFPNARRIFFMGVEPGRGVRAYVLDLDPPGRPVAVSAEDTRRGILAGDGRTLAARASDGDWYLYPTGGGPSKKADGVGPGEEPFQWTQDGRFLYVRGSDRPDASGTISSLVYRVDPWSGAREAWKEILPVNPAAGGGVGTILFADDGRVCVYTHRRYSSDLFLAEGLR